MNAFADAVGLELHAISPALVCPRKPVLGKSAAVMVIARLVITFPSVSATVKLTSTVRTAVFNALMPSAQDRRCFSLTPSVLCLQVNAFVPRAMKKGITMAWTPAAPDANCFTGVRSARKGADVSTGEAASSSPVCANASIRMLTVTLRDKAAKSARTCTSGQTAKVKT